MQEGLLPDVRQQNGERYHEERRPSLDAQYCTLRSEAISVDVDAAKHAPILCVGVTVYSIAMRRLKSYTRHSDRHSRTRVA